MIKLMVVDDEVIIRKGIRYCIEWDYYGIEVVGEASDGESAIKTALTLLPDIVLADVKMPIMNGIDMARELQRLLPHVKIIMLSGYDDNPYLMASIKTGVTDYILKSANQDDIVAAVLKTKAEILAERKIQEQNFDNGKILEQYYLPIRRSVMTSLIKGNKPSREILELSKKLDIELPGPLYLLFYVKLNGADDVQPLLIHLLFQLNTFSPFIVADETDDLIGLLNIQSTDSIPEVFNSFIKSVKEREQRQIKLYISDETSDLEAIPDIYHNLMKLVGQGCWDANYSVMHVNSVQIPASLPLDSVLMLEREIIQSFSLNNHAYFKENIEKYRAFLRDNKLPLDKTKESVKRIVVSLYNIANMYEEVYKTLEAIDRTENVEEVFDYLYLAVRPHNNSMPRSQIITSALKYIEAHCHESLQLNDIAFNCSVSPSYLSKIFKNEMNIGVVKYIHNLRIERAKLHLSNSSMKVVDISALVGYSDYKYFSHYFLKITGMSPREYRASSHNDVKVEA